MPSKPKTIKELKEQRRKENFVGRAEQQQVFLDNFAGDEVKWVVLSVTGEGGVGKSTLLKRYTQLAQGEDINANVVYCDDRQYTPVDAMAAIAEQLEKVGIESKKFNERYKKYRETLQQIESDPTAPRGMVNVVTRGLTDFTIKSLRRLPGVGVAADYVDEQAAGDAIADLAQYALTRWGNKDEVILVREPEKILTPLFVDLLNEATKKKRLVVMFDAFERTASTLSSWIIELVDNKHGDFGLRVSFIVSGRNPLDQHWTELTGLLVHVKLELFGFEETKQYLANQEITDAGIVQQVYQSSGGLPVLVELLAASKPQIGIPLPDVSQDAVERFLQWTPEDKREFALLSAVPRQFNRDILSEFFGADAEKLFNWLSGQSYILRNQVRGWYFHEKVRELMLQYQGKRAPMALADTHTRLARFFTQAQSNLNIKLPDVYYDQTWGSYEIERVYHLFMTAPNRRWDEVLNSILPTLLYQPSLSFGILNAIVQATWETGMQHLTNDLAGLKKIMSNQFVEIEGEINFLNQLDNRELNMRAKQAVAYCRGLRFNAQHQYDLALSDFDFVIKENESYLPAIAMRSVALFGLDRYNEALLDFEKFSTFDKKAGGSVSQIIALNYEFSNKWEKALEFYNRTITIDSDNSYAHMRRGFVYYQLGKDGLGLQDFKSSLKAKDAPPIAYLIAGVMSSLQGHYDEAVEFLNKYIELGEEIPEGLSAKFWMVRGVSYGNLHKYESALADLNKALELGEDKASLHSYKGQTYAMMGDFEKAGQEFEHAIELDPKTKDVFPLHISLINAGKVFNTGSFDEFLPTLNRLIELDIPGKDYMIASRAVLYAEAGEYEKAVDDFENSKGVMDKLPLHDGFPHSLMKRADSYLNMMRYQDAINDYNRIVKMGISDFRVFTNRGLALFAMGNLRGSLLDIEKAIQLGEEDVFSVITHGIICRYLGDLDHALVDFNTAADLDQSTSDIFLQRGHVYRLLSQYELALKDFEYVLEINSENVEALTGLAWIYQRLDKIELAEKHIQSALSIKANEVNHYGRAIALILSGHKTEAVTELEMDMDNPLFRIVASMDDLLNPIRELPEYNALLARYQ